MNIIHNSMDLSIFKFQGPCWKFNRIKLSDFPSNGYLTPHIMGEFDIDEFEKEVRRARSIVDAIIIKESGEIKFGHSLAQVQFEPLLLKEDGMIRVSKGDYIYIISQTSFNDTDFDAMINIRYGIDEKFRCYMIEYDGI